MPTQAWDMAPGVSKSCRVRSSRLHVSRLHASRFTPHVFTPHVFTFHVFTSSRLTSSRFTSSRFTPHVFTFHVFTFHVFTSSHQPLPLISDLSRGGVVRLADAYDPGWRATCNGRPAQVLRVDHALRGVVAPPGHSVIEFRYQPRSFTYGLLLAGIGGARNRRRGAPIAPHRRKMIPRVFRRHVPGLRGRRFPTRDTGFESQDMPTQAWDMAPGVSKSCRVRSSRLHVSRLHVSRLHVSRLHASRFTSSHQPLPLISLELVVQRSPADPELGGGRGAVAVVALQRRQDVLALDFFQRPPRVVFLRGFSAMARGAGGGVLREPRRAASAGLPGGASRRIARSSACSSSPRWHGLVRNSTTSRWIASRAESMLANPVKTIPCTRGRRRAAS